MEAATRLDIVLGSLHAFGIEQRPSLLNNPNSASGNLEIHDCFTTDTLTAVSTFKVFIILLILKIVDTKVFINAGRLLLDIFYTVCGFFVSN